MKIEFAAVGKTHLVRLEGRTVLELDGKYSTFHWASGPPSQWEEMTRGPGDPGYCRHLAAARQEWFNRLATALDAIHGRGGECQCRQLEASWTLYGPRRGKISGGDALPIHVSEHSDWTTLEVQTARWQ